MKLKNIFLKGLMGLSILGLVACSSSKDNDDDLLLLLLLANQPSAGPQAAEFPRFLYVASWGTNEVIQYGVNATSGSLTQVGVTGADTNPTALTVNPDGTFLYAAAPNANAITRYTITRETGVLERVTPSTSTGATTTGILPQDIQFDPTGRFLYTANQGSDTISSFTVNTTSGALTTITAPITTRQTVDTPVLSSALRIHPTGRFLYTVNILGRNTAIATVAADTGTVTAPALFQQVFQDSGDNSAPGDLAIDPTGRFLYVLDGKAGQLRFWRINQSTGAVTDVATEAGTFENPLNLASGDASANPRAVRIDPTGRFLYVLNYNSRQISLYTIDPFRGYLTFVNSQRTGNNPSSLYVDKGGRFVFVANSGSNTVGVYNIDTSNGRLNLISETAVGTDPRSVVSY
jgi:6-phosphogluconolactonase